MTAPKRLAQICLAVSSFVLSLAICELFLRWMGFSYTPLRIQVIDQWSEWRYFHAFQDQHFTYDPNLIWRPRNGVPPFNSQGYRGREIAVEKPPGSFRIFAIGDSNTLGWLGPRDLNWPAYLEEILIKQNPRFSVINAGAYGYSSYQGLKRLKEALPFQPDLVLISFGLNDAMRVTVSDVEFGSKRVRTLNLDRMLLKVRIGQLLLALIDNVLSRKRHELVPRVSLEEYENNLSEMVRLCQTRNIQIALLTRPFTGHSPNPWWWKNLGPAYNAAVIEVGRSTGVPVIDVYGHFREKTQYFVDESHFTEEGHQLMARLVYERIRPLLK